MRDPGLAAVLSAIIPGVGQFYNGRIMAGILWLIITPGLWIGTGGLLGWVCHVIAAYTAYNYARDHRMRISAPYGIPRTSEEGSSLKFASTGREISHLPLPSPERRRQPHPGSSPDPFATPPPTLPHPCVSAQRKCERQPR